MKYTIPAFVTQHSKRPVDWVELHDRLPIDGAPLAYHDRNQRDWWKLNVRIRELIKVTEEHVVREIKVGITPSVRIVSWARWAKILSCDRATLKHRNRYHWVDAHRTRLLLLIQSAKQQAGLPSLPPISLASQIEELEDRLNKQRNHTAHWYEKYLLLEQEVHEQNNIIRLQGQKIERLLAHKASRTKQLAK